MKQKADSSDFFPALVDLDKFNWTQEKAQKISVRANATEYELATSRETAEEKELGELLDSFSISCLLTPRERYHDTPGHVSYGEMLTEVAQVLGL